MTRPALKTACLGWVARLLFWFAVAVCQSGPALTAESTPLRFGILPLGGRWVSESAKRARLQRIDVDYARTFALLELNESAWPVLVGSHRD